MIKALSLMRNDDEIIDEWNDGMDFEKSMRIVAESVESEVNQ